MLQYRLYGGQALPAGLQGFMKAGANIGSVIGQFAFGFGADYFGRKALCTFRSLRTTTVVSYNPDN